jgi:hypothetical protein
VELAQLLNALVECGVFPMDASFNSFDPADSDDLKKLGTVAILKFLVEQGVLPVEFAFKSFSPNGENADILKIEQ